MLDAARQEQSHAERPKDPHPRQVDRAGQAIAALTRAPTSRFRLTRGNCIPGAVASHVIRRRSRPELAPKRLDGRRRVPPHGVLRVRQQCLVDRRVHHPHHAHGTVLSLAAVEEDGRRVVDGDLEDLLLSCGSACASGRSCWVDLHSCPTQQARNPRRTRPRRGENRASRIRPPRRCGFAGRSETRARRRRRRRSGRARRRAGCWRR